MYKLIRILLGGLIGMLVSSLTVSGKSTPILKNLDEVLLNRSRYFVEKRANINRTALSLEQASTEVERFRYTLDLCREYESFNFDTAYFYAEQLLDLAKSIDSAEYLGIARTRQAFSLLSAGLFREALDSLGTIQPQELTAAVRTDYYSTKSRCYLDIARFLDDDTFSPFYLHTGLALLDSAIEASSPFHLLRLTHQANRALLQNDLQLAEQLFIRLINDPDLPSRELAREAASLGLVYSARGDQEKALHYLATAAIADEQNCVKENTALMLVAQILHNRGDYERSDRYIDLALEDAYFYNARLRKFQILDVLPLIKARQVAVAEQKQKQLLVFIVLLSALLLVCLVLIYNNIKKNRALHHKEQKLTQAYQALENYTTALLEADKIKEHYIGYFFQRNTKFIKYADKLFTATRKALVEQNYKDAIFHSKQFHGRKEQQKLLREFDDVFLTVFPGFVNQFNVLFPIAHQYKIADGRLDDPELRIFALIRLGVKNNETIARALDYSVNTIYTYKTKVRNRSLLSNEDFDSAVMNITGLAG